MLCKNDLEDNIASYIKERLPKAKMNTVFDVGCNVGWFTYQFAQAFREARLYLFEPASVIFDNIHANLSRFTDLDIMSRTDLNKLALGHENFSAQITKVPGVTVNRIVSESSKAEATETVSVIKGDDFCKERNVQHINFLKVDAEGYDLKVLFGFTGMLSQQKIDFVQVEASMAHENTMHIHVDAFSGFLGAFGYRPFRILNQASFDLPYLVRADIVYINLESAKRFS